MKVPFPDVVVIRGAPGVGKSSVATCLASRFPRGAKVEVDVLRRMVISVDWKNQAEHIRMLDAAAGLTDDLARFGFVPVIVVDTFSGDKLTRFLDVLRGLHNARTVQCFALHVAEEVLCTRLAHRSDDAFKDFGISRKLNADVTKLRYPGERLIDATVPSPDGVAVMIHEALAEAVDARC